MATEIKETDVPTRTELRALIERFGEEDIRFQNKAEQTNGSYWQGVAEGFRQCSQWLEELLDNHLPDGGNFDEMPF